MYTQQSEFAFVTIVQIDKSNEPYVAQRKMHPVCSELSPSRDFSLGSSDGFLVRHSKANFIQSPKRKAILDCDSSSWRWSADCDRFKCADPNARVHVEWVYISANFAWNVVSSQREFHLHLSSKGLPFTQKSRWSMHLCVEFKIGIFCASDQDTPQCKVLGCKSVAEFRCIVGSMEIAHDARFKIHCNSKEEFQRW